MSKNEYTSPYIKTDYTGTISIRNPNTGEMEDVTTSRTVYQNAEINPQLVIPKGTKIGKEVIKEDTTNLDRMSEGKSPLVTIENEDGSITYERIELHHLTGRELQPETQYFNGQLQDGTLVEIRSSVHDAQQIHNLGEKTNSFRKVKVETVDEDGKTVRSIEKSYGAIHYEKARSQYWQDRAAAIIQSENASPDKGGTNMSWLDRFKSNDDEKHEEGTHSLADQRQSFLDSLKVDSSNNTNNNNDNNNNNNNDDNNSSAPDPMEKGDERDEPGHTTQEDDSEHNGEDMDMDDDMEL